MADFRLTGNKGIWLDNSDLVLMQEGEQITVIQWGNGPRDELLDIVYFSLNGSTELATSCITDNGTVVKNEQRLQISGKKPGSDRYHAYIKDTRQDYSEPMDVKVLPAMSTEHPADHLIFWSEGNRPRDFFDFLSESNRAAKAKKGIAFHLRSVADLLQILFYYRDSGRKISAMEFDTHGCPGGIRLGLDKQEYLYSGTLGNFRGKGFNRLFVPGARIFFHGCNVAEGDEGRGFLIEVGQIFLTGGGGSVGGSTSTGWGAPRWFDAPVWHFTGSTVRVYIANDGSVTKIEETNEPVKEVLSVPSYHGPVESSGHRF